MSVDIRRDEPAAASWGVIGTAMYGATGGAGAAGAGGGTAPAAPIRVLGPLQVVTAAGELQLGSVTQRAILAYLLLHQNQVVATGELIDALWRDHAPASARKIVQNSVSRLRRILTEAEATPDVWLLTRSPGYQLVMPTSKMDICVFYTLVHEGKDALASGCPAAAAGKWRQALSLWRGPALADIAAAGMVWPQMRALEDMRLDALEDLFDVELGCGRHDFVLTELQGAARANPERERLQILLMLALHRSGRSADALGVYEQVRAALADRGMCPGPALQDVERSVRGNDETLLRQHRTTDSPAYHPAVTDIEATRPVPQPSPQPGPPEQLVPRPRGGDGPLTERKQVTILLLKAATDWAGQDADQEEVDGALSAMDAVIHREVGHVGGVVTARVGSLWSAVFGITRNQADDAHRAVLAAFSIRCGFAELADTWPQPVVRAAIATGQMLVRYPAGPAGPPEVSGTALEECHAMLPSVGPMRIWVNAETHRSTERKVVFERVDDGVWAAQGVRIESAEPHRPPLIGREKQVQELTHLLTDRQPPHVIAIVGEPGSGRTRLIEELGRVIDAQPDRDTPLMVTAPTSTDDTAPVLLTRGLQACCGITQWDAPELARTKLRRTIARTSRDETEQAWLTGMLGPLVTESVTWQDPQFAEVLRAWWQFVERVGAERKVAVVIDDLDSACFSLSERISRLSQTTSTSSLLIVATMRVAPRALPTGWGRDGDRTTQIRLSALTDEDIESLVTHLVTRRGIQTQSEPASAAVKALAPFAAGNPLLAAQYGELLVKSLGSGPDRAYAALLPVDAVSRDLPVPVRQAVSTQLDDLPTEARGLAMAASVVGEVVWAEALVAATGRSADQIESALGHLIDAGILTKSESSLVEGDGQYAFSCVTTRSIVYSRVPRSQRIRMHARVMTWIEQLPSYRAWALLTFYRDQVVRLSSATGQSFDEVLLRSSEQVADIVGDAVDTISDVVRYHLVLATIATHYPLELNSLVRKWHAWLLAHKRPSQTRRTY